MADEITMQFQVQLVNGTLRDSYSGTNLGADQSSAALVRNVQTILHTGHSALELGGVSTPGWAVFINLSDTDYVEIGIDVGATFYPFLKLDAEEEMLCHLGISAPYAQADTASVDLYYIIYDS